jgi:hypothetical protein
VIRRSKRQPSGLGSGAALAGVALLSLALMTFGALGYFYFTLPQKPKLDRVSLCPVTGPQGVTVVLVDTTDDLPEPAQRQVLGMLDELIMDLPTYHKLDIRVLDIAASRSQSLFSKCNPGDGTGLSEWTDNPRIARLRWIDAFRRPAAEAVKNSVASAKAKNSPIMAAIQDIAIGQFSSAAVQNVPKSLIVISDMLEFTPDYSQYPGAGDLSYARFRRSPAYLKFRTDLHGASVTIEYVQRPAVKIDTFRHVEFWKEWITDNRGTYKIAQRLQGAANASNRKY